MEDLRRRTPLVLCEYTEDPFRGITEVASCAGLQAGDRRRRVAAQRRRVSARPGSGLSVLGYERRTRR